MIVKDNFLIEVEDSDIINGCFVLPKEIENVAKSAFDNCHSLTSITVFDDVHKMDVIKKCASAANVFVSSGQISINLEKYENSFIPRKISAEEISTTTNGKNFLKIIKGKDWYIIYSDENEIRIIDVNLYETKFPYEVEKQQKEYESAIKEIIKSAFIIDENGQIIGIKKISGINIDTSFISDVLNQLTSEVNINQKQKIKK